MSKYVTLLELKDRRARITTTGSEIVTTWYCEPASAAPIVIAELLGGVTGNTANDRRRLPARDYAFPYCYCVSAYEVPLDPRAAASGPTGLAYVPVDPKAMTDMQIVDAGLKAPAIFDGPAAMDDSGGYVPLPQADDKLGRCGCNIEAIYRPLYSVYNMPDQPQADDWVNSFDYVDPQFAASSRTFDIGTTARVLTQRTTTSWGYASGGTSAFITDTWQDITIRRVMCARVPWFTITALENRINKNSWQPSKFSLDGLFAAIASGNPGQQMWTSGSFPSKTLRFNHAEVIPRTVPSCLDSGGNILTSPDGIPISRPVRCYDILLHFSWRTTVDNWTDLSGAVQFGMLPWDVDWWTGQGPYEAFANLSTTAFFPGWYQTGTWVANGVNWLGVPYSTHIHRGKYQLAEDSYVGHPSYMPSGAPALPEADHPFDLLFLQNAP